MSTTYKAVNWNRNKRVYDRAIVFGIATYLTLFVVIGRLAWPGDEAIAWEVLAIRALGTCAYVMLHVVLAIGPLARWNRRLLPLVYNRRHLGVATFLVGAAHGLLTIGYYHGFGDINPLVSLLTSNTNYGSLVAFPFEVLGLAAALLLFLLAATSHDFWQRNLGPSVWKGLHMLVYPAYALLVGHVALGALQSESNSLYAALVALGLAVLVSLHVATGWRERRRDRQGAAAVVAVPGATAVSAVRSTDRIDSGWLDVGSVDEIADCRATTVCLPGRERVAVFRYGGQVSAVTNVCAHQRGPLGEGRVIDGCITCPWHGWEYRPQDGQSPPPFQERIATYRVRVEGRRILLDPRPLPPGTAVEPARFEECEHAEMAAETR